MDNSKEGASMRQKGFRLWPGVIAVVLQWVVWLGVPIVKPDAFAVGMLGGVVVGLIVLIWWTFFSRAPWMERLLGIALMVIAIAMTPQILHASIRTAGMGIAFYFYAIPVMSLALVVWAVLCHRFSKARRRVFMIVAVLATCGIWAVLRTEGISGSGKQDFTWRWAKTSEERLLDRGADVPAEISSPLVEAGMEGEEAVLEWPGFRGANRDGVVHGVQIATDWTTSPPIELWRRPIGPGWSSFAVRGPFFYTQEQRGEDEVVACYHLATGKPIWKHLDAVRFWESHAGAGPRATPTLHGDRVITLGATGILNALDAADGTLLWSRDAASDTHAEIPHWGFSSSPLVVDDVVVVDTGALAAFDLASGEPRWSVPAGNVSYSSPHLMVIDGVAQVLLMNGSGAMSVAPVDGTKLWEHEWPGASIVQPALTPNGDLLISALSASSGVGIRRLAMNQGENGWTVEESWTSHGLKPYFNDFVVHDGHVFGFDGRFVSCIGLSDGKLKWKGSRYGHGQLILLADQDLLLVLSEKGQLALIDANPEAFTERARFPAIEGKTWNHPVLVGDILLVRNAQEMAAFRLSLSDG